MLPGYHPCQVRVLEMPDKGRLLCATPPLRMSRQPFRLALNGRDFVSSATSGRSALGHLLWGEDVGYRYYPQRVTHMWPMGAPTAGGTRVTLTGEGFETFDNSAASARCRVVGDDSAWCEYYDEPLLQVPRYRSPLWLMRNKS